MSGSRRAKGEGTWEELPSGKVRLVKQRAGRYLKGPARPSKTEARAAWESKWSKPKGQSRLSFSTFARNWKTHQCGSTSTLEQLEIFVSSKIEADPIGDLPISSIEDTDVETWLRRQKGASSTIRRNLGRLKQILKAAGVECKVSRPKDSGHARRPLSSSERGDVDKILSQCDEPTRRAALIALYTGLRRSEIIALKHEDRDGAGVWVRRRGIATKGRLDIEPTTKSAKSRRWVPLPPQLEDMIGPPSTGFVLTDSKEPISPHALTKRFKRAKKGTSMEHMPFAGFHTLRRTYGMILLETGTDIVTASEMMGHDAAMLLKEYARSREDLKTEAAKRAFSVPTTQDTTHEKAI